MTQDLLLFDSKPSHIRQHSLLEAVYNYQQQDNTEATTSVLLIVGENKSVASVLAKEYVLLGYVPGLVGTNQNHDLNVINQIDYFTAQASIEDYIMALQKTINVHDKLYDQNSPVITDSLYDSLYKELMDLEADYPLTVKGISPTQKINTAFVTSLEKVKHSRPMLSLDKTTTETGIRKFVKGANGESIIVQRKEDGLTVVGSFNFGKIKDAVTRGNGFFGERVIHSISHIENIPKHIEFQKRLELRFEVVIPYEAFERINTNGKYSNPRNLASGSVRTLDGTLSKKRGLKAYVIEIVAVEGMEFTHDTERIEFVKSLGFEVSDTFEFFNEKSTNSIEDETTRLIDFIQSYDVKVRPTLPHMIDGLVLKYNRLALRDELGETIKFPRWGLAHKFNSLDATTTLRDIVVQVGKTGQLTPVCEFDMVDIAGVEIRRATLHNFKNIKEKDIQVGDKILVARANDVIPQVIKSFPELRSGTEFAFVIPPHCPECGGPLEEIGENVFCRGTNCESQTIGKFEHFVSRNAMNIDGCGDKTIAMLYEKGFAKDFSDIYRLEAHKQAITAIESFGDKKFDKMIKGIKESTQQPLNNVLYSLSINLIGESASKEIAKVFPSMDAILEAAKNPFILSSTLLKINDFGDKMTNEFVEYFTKPENVELIKRLRSLGLTMQSSYEKPASDSNVAGKVFVITGSLSKDRSAFKNEIESLGGKVTGSVSKRTNYLLMGPDASGTTKHTNAIKLGVQILSEEEYLKLIK